jgi:hypothetical protein
MVNNLGILFGNFCRSYDFLYIYTAQLPFCPIGGYPAFDTASLGRIACKGD